MTFFNSLITTVFAAQDDIVGVLTPPSGIISDVGSTNSLLRTIFIFLITTAGLFSFVQFILGGFGIITSAGDSSKAEAAQKQITNAIVGLVVIGASFVLAAIMGQLLFSRADFIFNPQLQSIN